MLAAGFLDFGKMYPDTAPLHRWKAAIDMCRAAENAGFTRYWLAEHHVPEAAFPAPEVILPVLAAATAKILVGPAGVLLPYYAPLKVAEIYLTMSAAFAGRIELGVCRGPGVANPLIAQGLLSGTTVQPSPETFERNVHELAVLLDSSRTPEGGEQREQGPYPLHVAPPQLYVLGSSMRSVRIAVAHGLAYAYPCFYPNSAWAGPEMLRRYRSGVGREMHAAACIALSVVCEETDARARARNQQLIDAGTMPSNIVGEPAACAAAIRATADAYGVSSVVLASFDDRLAAQLFLIERLGTRLLRPSGVMV